MPICLIVISIIRLNNSVKRNSEKMAKEKLMVMCILDDSKTSNPIQTGMFDETTADDR